MAVLVLCSASPMLSGLGTLPRRCPFTHSNAKTRKSQVGEVIVLSWKTWLCLSLDAVYYWISKIYIINKVNATARPFHKVEVPPCSQGWQQAPQITSLYSMLCPPSQDYSQPCTLKCRILGYGLPKRKVHLDDIDSTIKPCKLFSTINSWERDCNKGNN